MGDATELIRRVTALTPSSDGCGSEGLAGDVLHHENAAVCAGHEVVDAANIRMTDRPREKELLPERFIVARHSSLFANDLERYGLLSGPVVREENFPHAALAETLADFIAIVHNRTER